MIDGSSLFLLLTRACFAQVSTTDSQKRATKLKHCVCLNYIEFLYHFLGDDSRSLPVSSKELTGLFNSLSSEIHQTFVHVYESFAGDVLDEKGIAHIGNEIKSLSSKVPVIYNPEIYERTKGFSPGALFIFEVEVTFENGKLKVTEKVIVLGVFCHSYLVYSMCQRT